MISHKKINIAIAIFSFIFTASPVIANDYFWIIGGGPVLENSQSQIELNVKWAREVIYRNTNEPVINLFYADGNNSAPDVVNRIPYNADDNDVLIFDHIFGGTDVSKKQYYKHTIQNVTDGTRIDILKPRLESDFKNVRPQDKVLILYNGHGGFNGTDYGKNYLKLWGETRLTVYEFEKLLSKINPKTPTRFVMTQCFSGAFYRAIHPNADSNTLDLKANRCGFFAESARREAEGCSASMKVDDYRDYTTYFFAALDGKTRQNKKLVSNPDLNSDHIVTLREAHLYTLATAYSTDLSRSTSEQYLDKWLPWYLRWLTPIEDSKNSIYYRTAKEVVRNNNVEFAILTDMNKYRVKRKSLSSSFRKLQKKKMQLNSKIKSIQKKIIKEIEVSFSDVKLEYKSKLKKYNQIQLDKLKYIIKNHADYNELLGLFGKKNGLMLPMLDAERRLTQIEKIQRLVNLAKIDIYFSIFSDYKNRLNYSSLVECEDSSL